MLNCFLIAFNCLQYICDKYGPNSTLYPTDPQQRAIVNQRMCFNMSFFYSAISQYVVGPMFFDYPRNATGLKKVHLGLEAFEEYLKRTNTKYAAGDNLTIADFPLVGTVMCLESINFPFDKFTLVKKWYDNFKLEFPELWTICETGMKELAHFEKNPPDLSAMVHPFHPIRKIK